MNNKLKNYEFENRRGHKKEKKEKKHDL